MNAKQSQKLCAAFQQFVFLSQVNSDFLKKGSNLPFKKNVLATIESFQEYSESIESFLDSRENKGEEEKEGTEKEEEKEDSGYEELFENPKEKKIPSISLSNDFLWQISCEHFLTATNDQKFATWNLENLDDHEHQDLFYAVAEKFHQSAEKFLKCFWLLKKINTMRLFHLMKTSTKGDELYYYHSHNLTLLAKGIQMKRGKLKSISLSAKTDICHLSVCGPHVQTVGFSLSLSLYISKSILIVSFFTTRQ